MKAKPKFVKKEAAGKSKIPLILVVLGLIVIAAVCAVFFLKDTGTQAADNNAADSAETAESQEAAETTAATKPAIACATIETAYLPVQFPEQYMENMEHREVTEGEAAMEIFTLTKEDTQLELFRIYFGDVQTGNPVGVLNMDGREIPVTLSVCEYRDDIFTDAETRDLYYDMMDGLNTVLSSIQNDSRFSNEEKIIVEKTDNQLSYWKVSLPQNMEWEELEAGENYVVTFYGNVNGEKVKLYAIAMGDTPLKNVLGTYMVDGAAKTVSVESYELPEVESWPQSSVTELYKMMETINDVIQTIMTSENFSDEAVPES